MHRQVAPLLDALCDTMNPLGHVEVRYSDVRRDEVDFLLKPQCLNQPRIVGVVVVHHRHHLTMFRSLHLQAIAIEEAEPVAATVEEEKSAEAVAEEPEAVAETVDEKPIEAVAEEPEAVAETVDEKPVEAVAEEPEAVAETVDEKPIEAVAEEPEAVAETDQAQPAGLRTPGEGRQLSDEKEPDRCAHG